MKTTQSVSGISKKNDTNVLMTHLLYHCKDIWVHLEEIIDEFTANLQCSNDEVRCSGELHLFAFRVQYSNKLVRLTVVDVSETTTQNPI